MDTRIRPRRSLKPVPLRRSSSSPAAVPCAATALAARLLDTRGEPHATQSSIGGSLTAVTLISDVLLRAHCEQHRGHDASAERVGTRSTSITGVRALRSHLGLGR